MTKKIYLGVSILALAAMLLSGCGAAPVTSLEDLQGRTIGVQNGTTGEMLAGDINNANVTGFETAAEAVKSLKKGKIDAVMVDLETAESLVADNKNIAILDEEFADERYAIAINKENKPLRSEINGALRALQENGTLSAIKANYEGDEQGKHAYEPDPSVQRTKGTLVMATNAEFPPYEYMYQDQIVGFDVDMMQAVCDYLGYELQIQNMSFESVLPAVANGTADVGVAGLSITPAREKKVLFSDFYAVTHQVIIVSV